MEDFKVTVVLFKSSVNTRIFCSDHKLETISIFLYENTTSVAVLIDASLSRIIQILHNLIFNKQLLDHYIRAI